MAPLGFLREAQRSALHDMSNVVPEAASNMLNEEAHRLETPDRSLTQITTWCCGCECELQAIDKPMRLRVGIQPGQCGDAHSQES